MPGYDSVQGYVRGTAYFGAIVGRYGNRIGKGKFTLEGKEYQLSLNDGPNHLHGGRVGFNKVLWDAEPLGERWAFAEAHLPSKDGEEGYPGNVNVLCDVHADPGNALEIRYEGKTDKATIFNPTHHSYFNLTGSMTKTILDHQLMIMPQTSYYSGRQKALITDREYRKRSKYADGFSYTHCNRHTH